MSLQTFIKPCKKRPKNCKLKNCSECCSIRENENLFLMATGGETNDLLN